MWLQWLKFDLQFEFVLANQKIYVLNFLLFDRSCAIAQPDDDGTRQKTGGGPSVPEPSEFVYIDSYCRNEYFRIKDPWVP